MIMLYDILLLASEPDDDSDDDDDDYNYSCNYGGDNYCH
jgi:hypothetical protein